MIINPFFSPRESGFYAIKRVDFKNIVFNESVKHWWAPIKSFIEFVYGSKRILYLTVFAEMGYSSQRVSGSSPGPDST